MEIFMSKMFCAMLLCLQKFVNICAACIDALPFALSCVKSKLALMISWKKLPPGPTGDLLTGFLYYVKPKFHEQLKTLADQYGPIFNLRMGKENVVVITDHILLKESYRQSIFDARPDTEFTKLLQGYGVINSSGPGWIKQRNMLHRVIRNIGLKKPFTDECRVIQNIQIELTAFLETLREMQSEPVDVRPAITRSISSVIGRSLMSVSSNDDNIEFDRVIYLIKDGFRLVNELYELNYLPSAKDDPKNREGFQKIKDNLAETNAYFSSMVAQHKETLDPDDLRDYLDHLLFEQNRCRGTVDYLSDEEITQILADVFSAGLEPVASSIEWAFLFMAQHPKAQAKIYQEILDVVGTERDPDCTDMNQMIYTQAVINEILRHGSVIPLGNPRAAVVDTKMHGYDIPKGTHIMPNLWAIHMDPKLWKKPKAFLPQRFIEDDRVITIPQFLPFSSGRRRCVGEQMATLEAFLYVANIVKHFKIERVKQCKLSTNKVEVTISMKPKPFKIKLTARQPPA